MARRTPSRPEFVVVVEAALAMGVLAWLSIQATSGPGRIALIWPANAVIMAALLRTPVRHWPWFLVGGALANLGADFLVGDQPAQALALTGCNSFEILLCAAGCRRLIGGAPDFARFRDLLVFGIAALAASVASALAAAVALQWISHRDFWRSLGV